MVIKLMMTSPRPLKASSFSILLFDRNLSCSNRATCSQSYEIRGEPHGKQLDEIVPVRREDPFREQRAIKRGILVRSKVLLAVCGNEDAHRRAVQSNGK